MLETDEHVIVDSGGEKCISAGNIWRVNRLDRGHDPVMVPADSIRQSSAISRPSPVASFGRSNVGSLLVNGRPIGVEVSLPSVTARTPPRVRDCDDD